MCMYIYRYIYIYIYHTSPNYSPLLRNTCVRRVVLDECFPLTQGLFFEYLPPLRAPALRPGAAGHDSYLAGLALSVLRQTCTS